MMKSVLLGKTTMQVSPLGLGTVKFGRNQGVKYPEQFELPTDKTILELLTCAKELGINLLDTAPAYGKSEERLGTLLTGQRHEWILSTKVGEEFIDGVSTYDFSPPTVRLSIERSLQRLKTDYLDIVLVHSNGDDKKIIEEYSVFETLSELKKAGTIRAYGMSTKTVEGGLLTIDYADVAMVTFNPLETSEQQVINYAHSKNKGIFIKKAFASGHLDKIGGESPVQKTLSFIFAVPGVTSVILGTINKNHLQDNVVAYEQSLY